MGTRKRGIRGRRQCMRRGSDISIDIAAPDLDADVVEKVYVNINQLGISMKKEAELIDGIAKLVLTAEETRKLAAGPFFMQIEAIAKDGTTVQSDIIRHSISDTLSEVRADVKSGNGFDISNQS